MTSAPPADTPVSTDPDADGGDLQQFLIVDDEDETFLVELD